MSFNAFMPPALPQTPAPDLNRAPGKSSVEFKSNRLGEASDQSKSFSATLNRISDLNHHRKPNSTAAEKQAVKSRGSDNGSVKPDKMSKTKSNTQDDIKENGAPVAPVSGKESRPIHPWLALFGLKPYDLINGSVADDGSVAVEAPSDSTTGPNLRMLTDLITHLNLQAQKTPGEQVGIGPFEQLQANISPEATNLYFFEQLAAGAFNHQDSAAAMGIWRYGSWMATLSAANLSAQTEALGPNANPVLAQLLPMQGVDSPALGSNALGDGAGEQKPAANPATFDLNAEFLFKMFAQSPQGGSDTSENTQTTVAGNTKDGRLSSLAADILNSEITAETKFQPETKNSKMHLLQATDRPSDQTVNSKLAAEVAVAKPAEEAFNLKGAAFKNQMPLSGEIVDKVIKIEGENKDNSLLYGQDQMPGRLAKFADATPTSESAQRSLSLQAMNQIVQKAVLSFNNGQNEVRIDLKPEFLGHIRMHIVTDSHQVAVKILAESPFVKDMLNSNLNQLKADLQAQGLKVDQLEVSVAHDSHSGTKNQTTAGASKSSALRADTASGEAIPEEQIKPQTGGSKTMTENAIDFFA